MARDRWGHLDQRFPRAAGHHGSGEGCPSSLAGLTDTISPWLMEAAFVDGIFGTMIFRWHSAAE